MQNKKYKEKYTQLVEMERKQEIRQHEEEIRNMSGRKRESKGRALVKMKGRDKGKGLGGKYIVKFLKISKNRLPDLEIGVGDLIMVSKNDPLNNKNPTGTVIEKTNYSISVVFDDKPQGFVYSKNVRIDLYVNDVTFQRMLDALEKFSNEKTLNRILLGEKHPTFNEKEIGEINNKNLDKSQIKAVKKSLKADDLFLVHGPPGTGKTTTLIEIIEQHIDNENKVLATAASNVAVDNLVDFLNKKGKKVVRVGHPARVTKSIRKHTLDFLVEKDKDYQKAKKLRERVSKLDKQQERYTYPSGRWRRGLSNKEIKKKAKQGRGTRGIPKSKIEYMAEWIKLQEKIGDLIKQAEKLEGDAVNRLLDQADVICTTNSTAGSELLEGRGFDVVVIDEATQATEPSCLISISHANKVVMAGDHKQLPPTILNERAKKQGLEKTLFERMLKIHGKKIKSMLSVQYRMNTDIMEFPSDQFYNGRLRAHDSVKNHKLRINVKGDSLINKACKPENVISFIDIKGKYKEHSKSDSSSRENPGEAGIVKEIINKLDGLGIDPKDIGVISPYYDQIDLLNKKINKDDLEVKTVDGFQGREKDIIILSFVRSNRKNIIGFLEDLRRLNVSITRAKKKLIMVGDSDTLKSNDTYKELIEYTKNKGRIIRL